jgi:hypothetical protein
VTQTGPVHDVAGCNFGFTPAVMFAKDALKTGQDKQANVAKAPEIAEDQARGYWF